MTARSEIIAERFKGLFFIIAPLLFSSSTFFWTNGQYSATGATLLILSMVFWVPVFFALFAPLKQPMPVYYHIGLIAAIYGTVVGGIGFGYLGYFSTVFDISQPTYIETLSHYPASSNILLFQAGPFFPLSLLILAIILLKKKFLPAWMAMMIIAGAIAFPLSRIPRIQWLAHAADVMLSLPLIVLGYNYLKRKTTLSFQPLIS